MWSSAYDCRTILLSVQSLFGGKSFKILLMQKYFIFLEILILDSSSLITEPNNESPLNSYAATLWSNQEGVLILSSTIFVVFFEIDK